MVLRVVVVRCVIGGPELTSDWAIVASHPGIGPPGPSPSTEAERAARFPRLAAGVEVVVRAGDALFVPLGWWHQLDSAADPGRGMHMMVNSFFD